jgi:uncharacterized protein YciI
VTALLDEILTRWDDEDYETALMGLDTVIEEHLDWLQTLHRERQHFTQGDLDRERKQLTEAVAAVRNADQQRTDNNTRAGAR